MPNIFTKQKNIIEMTINKKDTTMPQSLTRIWIHIIFSTKDRRAFLQDEHVRHQLYDYIKSICKNLHCEVSMIGGIEDHIHILLSLNKKMSMSKLIEEIKKSSSKWIKTFCSSESILNEFYWQSGYGAFGVSESNLESVQQYIKNQAEHHKKYDFKTEYLKMLKQHKIIFDDKYLWN